VDSRSQPCCPITVTAAAWQYVISVY
jgi:hypothetical protein